MSDAGSRVIRARLLPSGAELGLRPGERLLDALDEQLQPGESRLPTACRAANCGACLVAVIRGDALLEPAFLPEKTLLAELDAAPDQRLGCQLCVAPGSPGSPAGHEPDLVLSVIPKPMRDL